MHPAMSAPEEKRMGLAYWAKRVLEEGDMASRDFAPDAVHDLRVAIRRCRSMAEGFRTVDPDAAWQQMRKLGKALFANLGDLRDTQVMCEWIEKLSEPHDIVRHTLLQTLQQREAQQKSAAQQALHDFDRKHWLSLNAHLANRTGRVPLESLVFQHLALERWHDAHQLHHQALRNRSQVSYHQLRIGIKRFRYTVENFLPQRHEKWAKDLRDLQDALGEVHDFDVLSAMIRAHPEISSADQMRWRKSVLKERQKRLDFYRSKMLGRRSLWYQWRRQLPSGEQLQQAVLARLRTWASFLDPDFKHATLVARLALRIYDGLAAHGVIGPSTRDRQLLEAAALLHEVGRSKRERGHHKLTYRMISKLRVPFGWDADELHEVSIVARYHRGALSPSSNAVFAGVRGTRRTELLRLAGILRLANAFDFAHDQTMAHVDVERRNGLLLVSSPGFESISPTAERLARARYLLEATCRVPVLIRPSTIRSAKQRGAPQRTARESASSETL